MRIAAGLFLIVAVSCNQEKKAPPPPPPDAAVVKTVPDGAVAQANPTGPATQRPGGPTPEACEKMATHLGDLVEDSALAPTAAQRTYLERVLARDRARVIGYCLDVAVPKEIACLTAAKDAAGTFGCDRFRRELPADIADASSHEPSKEDCDRFYDRMRGFTIESGGDVAALDKDRDQVVRTCQEKAKIGTVACFIASPTYDQARRCP